MTGHARLPDIVILAAGASSRMGGRDKLLEEVSGHPLLRRVAARALETGAPVTVVLPPDAPARQAALVGMALRVIIAEEARAGMAASLVAGLGALPADSPGVMILPADMPDLTPADLRLVLTQFATDPGRIWRGGTADGREGHPALFPADLIPALRALAGDEGGRSVIAANRDRLSRVALPGQHALLDLDTPEDWAAYRARGSGGE